MRLDYKHSVASPGAHRFNFAILGVMMWSGPLIYWANDVYRVGIDGFTAFHFLPDPVYRESEHLPN